MAPIVMAVMGQSLTGQWGSQVPRKPFPESIKSARKRKEIGPKVVHTLRA
jgi:hypothetical protein